MVHFLRKVGDWFARWEARGGGGGGGGGGVALYLRIKACSSFSIAKLFESSASRVV